MKHVQYCQHRLVKCPSNNDDGVVCDMHMKQGSYIDHAIIECTYTNTCSLGCEEKVHHHFEHKTKDDCIKYLRNQVQVLQEMRTDMVYLEKASVIFSSETDDVVEELVGSKRVRA